MDTNSLFPLKYRLRKTDELVEVIAWETVEKGARNENDWVSYIDASGVEHIKEHLTFEWDFVAENPFERAFDYKPLDLPKFDAWEQRRYEMVKQQVIEEGAPIDDAIALADEIIAKLNPENKVSMPEEVVYIPNKGL